jgi:hypothetical protein
MRSKPMETLCHLAFILGYEQSIPSRTARRFLARTQLHRAWLAGNQGCIGEPEGVLYRRWYTNRKAHKNAGVTQLWRSLRDYYGLKNTQWLVIAIAKDIIHE